jgi:hypothetical protein
VYRDLTGIFCTKHLRMELFLSMEYLDKSVTFFPLFRTQYNPDFIVVEHYGCETPSSSNQIN